MRLRIAPRRLWGWEPEEIHIEETDDEGRKIMRVIREPEFDAEQQSMLLALMEHDASLDQYGIPVDEATSPDADPMNPNAKYHFEARVLRNFAAAAV